MKAIQITYRIFWLLLLGSNAGSIAQDVRAKELFDQVSRYYEQKESYSLSLDYAMFNISTKPEERTEHYTGSASKQANFYTFKVLQSEMLVFGDKQLIFDHKQKTITYLNNDSKKSELPVDLSSYLRIFDQNKLSTNNSFIICELTSSKLNFQNPYSKIVLYVDKDSKALVKQELFFGRLVPFSDNETGKTKLNKGKLVIGINEVAQQKKKTPRLEDFIKVSGKNKIQLRQEYNIYKLIIQENKK